MNRFLVKTLHVQNEYYLLPSICHFEFSGYHYVTLILICYSIKDIFNYNKSGRQAGLGVVFVA